MIEKTAYLERSPRLSNIWLKEEMIQINEFRGEMGDTTPSMTFINCGIQFCK